MTVSPDNLIADPAWLPHTFDPSGDRLDFVRIPPEEREAVPFLAEEYVGQGFAHATPRHADIAAAMFADDRAPQHFIFHTAFCCSSLLARALAAGGAATSLREPDILLNLANRLLREPSQANLDRLDLVLRLLSRPFAGEAIVIKPSNFANNLIGPILKLRPSSRAVLLHSDLAAFLRSIAKKGMWGRIWVRKLFLQLARWSDLKLGFSHAESFQLSDLQIAGLCWLMQSRHFRQLAGHHGARLVLLHVDDLLAHRQAALARLNEHFGLGYDAGALAAIAAGEVFVRDSKSGARAFDARDREVEHDAASAAHGEEIAMVSEWVARVARRIEIPVDLDDLDWKVGGA